jgi:hypothetical protein
MNLFVLSVSLDLLGVVAFGIWLCVLVWRRDLWLRYTAKEAAIYSRLHFPQWFIAAGRKFQEGRGVLYFAIAGLVISSLILISVIYLHIAGTRLPHSNTPPRISVTMDTNGVPRLAGVPLSNTNLRDAAFRAMGSMGVKGALVVPPLKNGDPQITNVINTLESMRRAGLLKTITNSPAGTGTNYSTSPFE